jgi:uncharacterized pyridoxamine 5'-phosphate oxidase family protein
MENKTITAKELFDKMLNENPTTTSTEMMIEFAKIKVKEALEAAAGNVEFDEEVLIRNSIFESYPLENIK